MREAIIHYHLFKNAGTSVDRILQETFGNGWTQIEGDGPRGRVMPEELKDLLEKDPNLKAVSSHQAILPPPEMADTRIVPIVMIRHPLDRARSVYWFERKQKTGSPGAEYAASHSFADYVRWRLDQSPNGVIHNFQTMFLLRRPDHLRPGLNEDTFAKAVEALGDLAFFGIVERFQESMERFSRNFPQLLPDSNKAAGFQNTTRDPGQALDERLAQMEQDLGRELYEELRERNRFDLNLYEFAVQRFDTTGLSQNGAEAAR